MAAPARGPKGVERMRVLLVLGALFLLCASLLAWMVARSEGIVARVADTADALHTLEEVRALQRDLYAQERILQRLPDAGERASLASRFAALDARIGARIERLAARRPGLDDAVRAYRDLRVAAAREFERAARAPGAEGVHGRGALDARYDALHTLLARVADALVAAGDGNAGQAREAAQVLHAGLAGLTAVIFVLSLGLGLALAREGERDKERRLLALFPERNAQAVLRLSRTAQVLYANPAAQRLLKAIGARGGDASTLLPSDLKSRLSALAGDEDRHETWCYRVDGRDLESDIHWLADLEVFYVYIADVTERRRAEERVAHQAYHDPTTDLPNRRMFQERVAGIFHAPERTTARAAVMEIGLDRFDVLVASLGHAASDELLRQAGARLSASLAGLRGLVPQASLYHFGNDLFCVLAPEVAREEVPVLAAEQMLAALRRPYYVGGREVNVTASAGISIYPLDGTDGPTLLRNADTAMQRAKQAGGGRIICYTRDMNERALEWLALENELRHAEALGELRLYFHPQIALADGRVIGAEALLRWAHPRRGLLAPAAFLHLAEESDLIRSLGEWILREACQWALAWRDAGLPELTVAVNLSARQFASQDLPARVAALLAETGLPAGTLELEITETAAMHDVARTTALMHELKGIGVRLAVDDFGTGFSSLSYLKRFPLDKLKIDQSFVQHLGADAQDAAIVRSVITLGHSLGLKVLAEGVETTLQRDWLREAGCDAYQGHFASPPLEPEAFVDFVRARTSGS